jgi:glutamate/aspartate transport system permease protein
MALEWQVFLEDDGGGRTYLEWMFEAWGWTLSVAGSAWLVAVVSGCLMGVLRTLPQDTRLNVGLARFANAWVELFRNIPVLVQIFLWYFVLPKVFPVMQQVPGFVLVVLGLGFFTSSRIAEMLRAGIQAMPRGQRYAAMAVGFTTWQTYRVSHHMAAAHQRVDELAEELVGGVCRVDCRTHHVRHAGARRNLAWH